MHVPVQARWGLHDWATSLYPQITFSCMFGKTLSSFTLLKYVLRAHKIVKLGIPSEIIA